MTTNHNTQLPDPPDEWVAVNDHLDYGLGFVSSGIASDIEARFGVFPLFSNASGWVQMLLRLETGHVAVITDMDATHLTPITRRTDDIGFTVGIYTAAQYEIGDSQWVLSAKVGAGELAGLIGRALAQYAAENADSSAPAHCARPVDLGAPDTFISLPGESPTIATPRHKSISSNR